MGKIFKEDSPIGLKVNRLENLLNELKLEIHVGPNQEIVIKDLEHKCKARVAISSSYRDGCYMIPRTFDEEKLFLMDWE